MPHIQHAPTGFFTGQKHCPKGTPCECVSGFPFYPFWNNTSRFLCSLFVLPYVCVDGIFPSFSDSSLFQLYLLHLLVRYVACLAHDVSWVLSPVLCITHQTSPGSLFTFFFFFRRFALVLCGLDGLSSLNVLIFSYLRPH